MEEGLLVPTHAISLAKQFLEASFDVVGLQETRTLLAGTIRLPRYTAISTDAGPEAFHGVQLWFRTPCLGTRSAGSHCFWHGSLFVLLEDPRILAVSARPLLAQKLLVVTFHAPHFVSGLIPKYTHGGPVLTNLWQPGICSSLTLCFWAEQQNNRSSVAPDASLSCFLATMHHEPVLDRCTDSAWTWQTPGGKTRHRIDYIALPDAWKHLQIHACNHPVCDIIMGSLITLSHPPG